MQETPAARAHAAAMKLAVSSAIRASCDSQLDDASAAAADARLRSAAIGINLSAGSASLQGNVFLLGENLGPLLDAQARASADRREEALVSEAAARRENDEAQIMLRVFGKQDAFEEEDDA
eukprot:Amastigsp_a341640_58.p3 type:complete len:121 gc:universal Amastigsp_a341640_58:655-293(-)